MPSKKIVVRDESGKPFSSWLPDKKFSYIFEEAYPVMWGSCEPEYEFSDDRKWRIDFAWPGPKVGVEVDGFGFGHQAISALTENHVKQNAAVEDGWKILRYTSKQLGSLQGIKDAVDQVAYVLCS